MFNAALFNQITFNGQRIERISKFLKKARPIITLIKQLRPDFFTTTWNEAEMTWNEASFDWQGIDIKERQSILYTKQSR